ncbi:hypothetical protein R1sor_017083 [Riccia sorocarpa]|uniref:Uncharacterized protein n=1 Tax=Riccia sorocarpa TaxID=122646 RepID=A0ABD3I6X8_9MARC
MGRDVCRYELDTNAITGPYQEGCVGYERETICTGGYGGYLGVFQETEDRLGQQKLGLRLEYHVLFAADTLRVFYCVNTRQKGIMRLCRHWSLHRAFLFRSCSF